MQKPPLQLEITPISQTHLIAEIKSLYARIHADETNCVDEDRHLAELVRSAEPGKRPRFTDQYWSTQIARHRTLLNEHHDFFLATQHPSASPACRRLPSKYAMPARLWRHGIHSFLDNLRHGLPESLEHMLSFTYLAYSMVALLFETVEAFRDTWIECLGDVARYRMAIEDENLRDREIWSGNARSWYLKAADNSPHVGRLYHHLAILARPDALKQLHYYSRSSTSVQIFSGARESVLILFQQFLGGTEGSYQKCFPLESCFITVHGLILTRGSTDWMNEQTRHFLVNVNKHIDDLSNRWKEPGMYMAISNIAALLEYGEADAPLRRALERAQEPTEVTPSVSIPGAPSTAMGQLRTPSTNSRSVSYPREPSDLTSPAEAHVDVEMTNSSTATTDDHIGKHHASSFTLYQAAGIAFPTLKIALSRTGNENVMPHIHVFFVFILAILRAPSAMDLVGPFMPWPEMASFLNSLAKPAGWTSSAPTTDFPVPNRPSVGRPLPEDYAMRGQIWSQNYFPPGWFEESNVDEDERTQELPSMAMPRIARVLWLGICIARVSLADTDRHIADTGRKYLFLPLTWLHSRLVLVSHMTATWVPLLPLGREAG